jgi:hypothetical protein
MSASRTSLAIDSRPSGPTLDLHTDAIILREGRGAVASTAPRGGSSPPSVTSTPTSTPTPTSTAGATPTPTESAPSPFFVRKTVFRAAPRILTVGPGPATIRARALVEAGAAARATGMSSEGRRRCERPARTPAQVSWTFFAAFALGAASAALMPTIADRGIELAIMATVIAGAQALAFAMSGKPHARIGGD